MNSYAISTRTSNVPVCQFQHHRATIIIQMRPPFVNFFFSKRMIFYFSRHTTSMRNSMRRKGLCLLAGLLLLSGCKETPPAARLKAEAAPQTAAPTAAPVSSPTAVQKMDLHTTARKLHIQEDTDFYTLHTIGFRYDEKGILRLNEEAFQDFCEELDRLYATASVDSQALLTDDPQMPFLFTEEKAGLRIDRTAFSALLVESSGDVTVPFMQESPKMTAEKLAEGFTLLSEFTTSFKGSTLGKANRVKNIALAASRIHGVVLEEGDIFSMNTMILDRTKENGYYTAAAIRNGTYEQEYGGGVCQVSSTLFNAVMMADLEIVERYHHSWPMHYVPIGRDATIATGQKDFRFKNTTGHNLYITAHADTENKTLTIRLYGVHSEDFAYIKVVSKQTGTLKSKGEKLLPREDLKIGERAVERAERQGKTSVTYKEYYDAQGHLLKKEVAFKDSYPSIEGLVYVSPEQYYG